MENIELNNVIQRLVRIEEKLDQYKEYSDDHENRIRFLEKGLWMGLGIIGLIELITNVLIK